MTSIATATVACAVLGLMATSPGIGTAQAAPVPSQGRLYGDPAAAAPYWRYQTYDDCVLMAAADVVGQLTGQEPSEQAIIKVAQSTPSTAHAGPVYTKPANKRHPASGKGTSFADEPLLLAHYGVHAVTTDDVAARTGGPTDMAALEHDLDGGHKAIVGVNAELLWGGRVLDKNNHGQPEADHAVVVTGVDTAAGIVHLNDSGTEKGRDEKVPIGTFVRSWASSGDQMTVTD